MYLFGSVFTFKTMFFEKKINPYLLKEKNTPNEYILCFFAIGGSWGYILLSLYPSVNTRPEDNITNQGRLFRGTFGLVSPTTQKSQVFEEQFESALLYKEIRLNRIW